MLKQQLKPWQHDGGQHAGCFAPFLLGHGGEAGEEGRRELWEQVEEGSEGRLEVQGCS